ncbi:hypothetical protein BDV59DRAFT_207238 [Aspergillus ambiguus]|uniref:Zn(II)2Cys6 transcription factor n=1 Tax=Aspergillus ambiguus TaxID=176160 RepID=UPI003CCD5758
MSSSLTEKRSPRRDQGYKRGYVACVGCRARKVRCVLTDSQPPCAKCRREHRECVYQATGKTGKHREPPRWAQSVDQPRQSVPSLNQERESEIGYERITQGEEAHSHSDVAESPSNEDSHPLTGRMMSTILARPRDALDILFDAAQSRAEALPSHSQDLYAQASVNSANPSSIISESGLVPVSGLSQPDDEVLDLWDKCRFVRQGWFTAQEAVTYLDLFYRYLAPLSPVLTDRYCEHRYHDQLIREEPMLCCTLLMISSRFFILPGAGGVSRSHFIHHRLWQYCELLIRRIMLGQEKYSTAKTRVVGSIESLMLISDWHPRSVHFPPDTEGWDGELISPEYDRANRLQTTGDVPLIRWREDVFEPAKRSERISWMLLGAAMSLAYELGVFSESSNQADLNSCGQDHQSVRIYRARKLLCIYTMQMAVRMGSSASLLPDHISFAPMASSRVSPINPQWEAYMNLWMKLTRLMKSASAMLFQSMPYVKQQLISGNYHALLQQVTTSIVGWHEEYTSLSYKALRPLILIEFHYLKTYTGSLSIQAVVERTLRKKQSHASDAIYKSLEGCVLPHDQHFIREVIGDSMQVMELATSMASQGRLRYSPLRTLLCITSSSIFLLKALSLGVRHAELQVALNMLERCILALRSSGTDDMDFSLRYATLIEKHVARFRQEFLPPQSSDRNSTMDHRVQEDFTGTSRESRNETVSFLNPFISGEDWCVRPFDPNIAPFSSNGDGVSLGLELDSLDFLWKLSSVGGA